MISGSGRCHYHPERAGLGICVECRHVICQECTTQFDGINRCARCLGQRLAKSRALPPRSEWTFGNVALALLSFLVFWGGLRAILVLFR